MSDSGAHPPFWRPQGRKAHRAVRDTAESMMEVQDYKPPKARQENPEKDRELDMFNGE